MRRFLIVLMTLLVLCGCASNNADINKSNPETEKEDFGEEKLNAMTSDEEVTKGVAAAKENCLAARIDSTVIGNVALKDASKEDVITRSGAVNKENSDFNDFIDFVYVALYEVIPSSAEYPAVKYIVGEWTFAIVAQQEILGTAFDEIGFADIGLNFDNGEMSLDLHPRILHYEYELYAEDDAEAGYLPFSGFRIDNNTFMLSDSDGLKVNIRNYYVIDGHEYVRAKMYISQDRYADVLFFRFNNQ